jgi:dimethylglycine catabolism B
LQRWHPGFFDRHNALTVFELLVEYISSGRIRLDRSRITELVTYHDPCNYGRKSEEMFGHGFYAEPRWILSQCTSDWVDLWPSRANQYCCGGGGGLMLTSFDAQREQYTRRKIEQIRASGATLIVVPCHSCHGQLRAMLKRYGMPQIKVKYLWEVVAEALVVPGVGEDSLGE